MEKKKKREKAKSEEKRKNKKIEKQEAKRKTIGENERFRESALKRDFRDG